MGLFDYARNIGKKLFGSEDEAPQKIKEHIEEENPGVSNLDVRVEDGVATLSGQAASAEAMEKAVLMAGNVEGIGEVRADGLTAPAPVEEVQYYEIQSGDTLSAIAKKYYGNASDYPRIFEANREVIKDADLIYPGQKIRIPMG
jgi:nucleoid-associated protein YgaU